MQAKCPKERISIVSAFAHLETSQAKRIIKKLDSFPDACHLAFRLMGPIFQREFPQHLKLEEIPQVFLHGNPHLDNYVRTFYGAGMADFDRSRLGPYAWDVVRFLSSVALRGESEDKVKIKKSILQFFIAGHCRGLENPDSYFPVPQFVKSIVPQKSEMTMKKYSKNNIKWAKKMRKSPLDITDKEVKKMLALYIESRNEQSLFERYRLVEAGKSEGSLGKMHYLFMLTAAHKKDKGDDLLIDIKETYCEEDNAWFVNPVGHHGLRMVKAHALYGPGLEQRLGYFTLDGMDYWAREIPCFNSKVKGPLSKAEQEEISFCVGVQLGRGHGRSCGKVGPEKIGADLQQNIAQYKEFSQYMNEQVIQGVKGLYKL